MCPMQILVSTKHIFLFDIDATSPIFFSLTISFFFHPNRLHSFISNLNDDCSQLSFEVYNVCVAKIADCRIFD